VVFRSAPIGIEGPRSGWRAFRRSGRMAQSPLQVKQAECEKPGQRWPSGLVRYRL